MKTSHGRVRLRGMRFTACFSLASVNDEIMDQAFQACQQAAICELHSQKHAYYKFYVFKLPKRTEADVRRGCRSTCTVGHKPPTRSACLLAQLARFATALIRPHGMDQCGTGQWQTTELEHMGQNAPPAERVLKMQSSIGGSSEEQVFGKEC